MGRIEEVLAPPNEEGTRATVLRWHKAPGERIRKDEPLLELETDKVTLEVASPASGALLDILKQPNAEVAAGEVLARIALDAEAGAAPAVPAQVDGAAAAGTPAPAGEASPAAAGAAGVGSAPEGASRGLLSPAVRASMRAKGLDAAALDASAVKGTGRDGRITARDLERLPPGAAAAGPRIAHTAIRRRVAEHMARSLAESPHVTTVFEADLTRVLAHRARRPAGAAAHEARPTLTAYFIHACARALARHPSVNATYHEDGLELHPDANIGIGTALGNDGLIVPVIPAAQRLGLDDIAVRLKELVTAARAGTLTRDQVRGGTFTLSNHGVSGSLLAAPIVIHQPQVAVLGIGRVERRVCVLEAGGTEAIAVRSRCYLTMTIDHRALDAFQANAFLSDVVATLERWDEAAAD